MLRIPDHKGEPVTPFAPIGPNAVAGPAFPAFKFVA